MEGMVRVALAFYQWVSGFIHRVDTFMYVENKLRKSNNATEE